MKRIEFETAKLAVEKGFGEEYGRLRHQDSHFTNTGEKVFYAYYEDDDWEEYKEKCKYLIPRPFEAELQQWLREQNIFLEVQLDGTSYPKFAVEVFVFSGIIADFVKVDQKDWSLYRTYEEALEVGLIEGLKQIKI